MDRGDAGTGVRAVLHHQGRRQGHRAGPEPGLRLRQAVRRPREDLQRGRRGHDGQDLSAAPLGRRATARKRDRRARSARRDRHARRSWWSRTTRRCAATPTAILRELGYRVLRRPSGAAALEILDGDHASICCSPSRDAGRHQRPSAGRRSDPLRRAEGCCSRPATPATPSSITDASTRHAPDQQAVFVSRTVSQGPGAAGSRRIEVGCQRAADAHHLQPMFQIGDQVGGVPRAQYAAGPADLEAAGPSGSA